MLSCDANRRWKKKSLIVALCASFVLLTWAEFIPIANAQSIWPFQNPFSPLVSFPLLRGEAKLTAVVPFLNSGYLNLPETTDDRYLGKNQGHDLKTAYNMEGGSLFLDFMARFQLDRFSFRTYFEKRMFSGTRKTSPNRAAYAILDYWGCGIGGDIDILLGNKSRIGLNFDQSFYGPEFTVYTGDPEMTFINGVWQVKYPPLSIQGPWSTTIGVHAVYNPTWNIFGMSAVGEAWLRWPIFGGTSVTDYKFSGGLKWPDTVLGSFSAQGGYRSTSFDFSLPYQGSAGAAWGNVFFEISYYYN